MKDDFKVMKIAYTNKDIFILSTLGKLYKCEIPKSNESDIKLEEVGTSQFQQPIVNIATGSGHILALDSDGVVYSWGNNEEG